MTELSCRRALVDWRDMFRIRFVYFAFFMPDALTVEGPIPRSVFDYNNATLSFCFEA